MGGQGQADVPGREGEKQALEIMRRYSLIIWKMFVKVGLEDVV